MTEGLRMFSRRIRIIFRGVKKYKGNEKQILKTIVDECFNGEFFQVSNGNFKAFYIRDLGICIKDLLDLGYRKECIKTLRFALGCYKRDNRVTTTITMNRKTVDFFDEAIDSFAFLCYCLNEIKDRKLSKESKRFIEAQAMHHSHNSIDKKTGLIRKDRIFSSIKDHGVRNSSCYDNCMIAMASSCLDSLGYNNPFKKFDYTRLIMESFWEGNYFYEDLNQKKVVTGDANVFPFWCNIIDDNTLFNKCLRSIKKEGLDFPLPLKYAAKKEHTKLSIIDLLSPNYEGSSIWAHLGLCFIDVVERYDKKASNMYVKKYLQKLKEHKNFLEIYDSKGNPFKTLFYYADEGLVWASKLFVKKYL